MIHFKEAARIDSETAKREQSIIPYDRYNSYDSYKRNAPTIDRKGESRYENRHGVRYEKRMDKSREISQEIKHEPHWVKEPYYGKYDKEDEYADEYARNDLYKQYEKYAGRFNNKFGSHDDFDDDDFGYGSQDETYGYDNTYDVDNGHYGYDDNYIYPDKYNREYDVNVVHSPKQLNTYNDYYDDEDDYRLGYDKFRTIRKNKYDDEYGNDKYYDTYDDNHARRFEHKQRLHDRLRRFDKYDDNFGDKHRHIYDDRQLYDDETSYGAVDSYDHDSDYYYQ
ncbi:hypothetical protein FBUS_07740 [Fasciolopsis buskii]|uniref:Uncharacterized protein n=1 Tax=Fasciolopsis buskii TaxID=27845 RepID=A0A8E0RIY5_9TREM|nr:hypothetical protein FBUS_07740 [Fasciolopsis buski]